MENKINNKIEKSKSYLLYFFMYFPLGCIAPLIGMYLAHIGFNGTQVGVITSLGTGAAALGGIFWGKIYSNSKNRKNVIIIMMLLAALTAVSSLMIKTFILYAFIYSVLYFFQGPSHGLCDSMVIENNENFPAIRAIGAIGYAAAVYVAGYMSEKFGLEVIFYMHGVTFLLACLIMKSKAELKNHLTTKNKEPQARKVGYIELFQNRTFRKLLVFAFFTLGTTMAHNTYFGYLYKEGGGSLKGIGIAFLLMAGSECLFMLLIPFINRKISTEKLLLFGVIIAIFRFGVYGLTLPAYILLGSFFLQGIMNGIILVETVKYFEKILEPRMASIGVAVYYALGNNLSAIGCNMLGGVILDKWGPAQVYIFFAVWNTIGLVVYMMNSLHKEAAAGVDFVR